MVYQDLAELFSGVDDDIMSGLFAPLPCDTPQSGASGNPPPATIKCSPPTPFPLLLAFNPATNPPPRPTPRDRGGQGRSVAGIRKREGDRVSLRDAGGPYRHLHALPKLPSQLL